MMEHSEEFKQEAVLIALTGGLSRERVAKEERDILKRPSSSSRASGREVCIRLGLASCLAG